MVERLRPLPVRRSPARRARRGGLWEEGRRPAGGGPDLGGHGFGSAPPGPAAASNLMPREPCRAPRAAPHFQRPRVPSRPCPPPPRPPTRGRPQPARLPWRPFQTECELDGPQRDKGGPVQRPRRAGGPPAEIGARPPPPAAPAPPRRPGEYGGRGPEAPAGPGAGVGRAGRGLGDLDGASGLSGARTQRPRA